MGGGRPQLKLPAWGTAEFAGSAVGEAGYPDDSLPEIALVGRSNVGKSSLINTLLGRRNLARTSSEPGRTRTINFYRVDGSFYFVDLPGYGYAKVSKAERRQWGPMIEGYLGRRPQLAGILQVVDGRLPAQPADVLMARWLREYQLSAVVAATKMDKVAKGRRKGKVQGLARELQLPVIPFSANTGEGGPEVAAAIRGMLLDVELGQGGREG